MSLFVYALAFVLIIGALVGALYYDYNLDLCVAAGGAGLFLMLVLSIDEWRRLGFSPSRLQITSATLTLLCGVPGYAFSDNTVVFLSCIAGFFLFGLLAFIGQVWSMSRKTRRHFARWKKKPEGEPFRFDGKSS